MRLLNSNTYNVVDVDVYLNHFTRTPTTLRKEEKSHEFQKQFNRCQIVIMANSTTYSFIFFSLETLNIRFLP